MSPKNLYYWKCSPFDLFLITACGCNWGWEGACCASVGILVCNILFVLIAGD